MTKLKLGVIQDDKPIRLTIELAGALHRDLLDYGSADAGDGPTDRSGQARRPDAGAFHGD